MGTDVEKAEWARVVEVYKKAISGGDGRLDPDAADTHLLVQYGLAVAGAIGDSCVPVNPWDAERRVAKMALDLVAKGARQALRYAELSSELGPAAAGARTPAIHRLTSGEANARINELLEDVQQTILVGQPGPRARGALEAVLERDLELLARGVAMRTLYAQTSQADPALRSHVEQLAAGGARFRTSSQPFAKVVIGDRRWAFFSDDPDQAAAGEAGAYLVTEPAMVGYLAEDFRRDWDTATEWARQPAGDGAPSAERSRFEQQREVMRQLAAGRTQAAAAIRLGMAKSTLTKIVKELMDERNLESSFQLAMWLGANPEWLRA
ncbi:hypothetical protein [Streptomyces beijiangensis]|uniref:Regulatory protein, luxR family n=1 Tax=Streptomyces beijiangensis TaxID=163361 RepID=A0A939JFH9_9ACTN|nr:hypothetical protein [Streptomyces beijiangensis]MBO0512403.1 hypothetical protein [Streptomyces beijiangensis]